MTAFAARTAPSFDLDYPMSLGTYGDYSEAQRVVDHLSAEGFPVENVSIVGTDLRTVERVTGRLTRGKVAAAGALSGLWLGVFVGVAFALFSTQGHLAFLITTPLLGALFGLIWSQLGYRALTRGGERDFSSVSKVVAARYDVLVEHKLAARAHELMLTQPRR
jgi:hypothetical protein